MLKKKSLTAIGDNLVFQTEVLPPYYLSSMRPALFVGAIGSQAVPFGLLGGQHRDDKFAQASDYNRFYLHPLY